MKHQPFEEWLLNETPITPEQKRELDLHLRSCAYCTAVVETGNLLSSAKVIAPAEGFTARFQTRLAERKLADRRRKLFGAVLFASVGIGILFWLAGPIFLRFLSTPESWLASSVEWSIFLITTFQALVQAGFVVLRLMPDFVSPLAWMVFYSAIAGLSLLWVMSLWRLTRVSQGV